MKQRELENIIEGLPRIISETVDLFTETSEKLIMMFGSLVTASSLLIRTSGNYKQRDCFPMLYLAIIGGPASNKGVVGYLSNLIRDIHRKILRENVERGSEYKVLYGKYKVALNNGEDITMPEKPAYRVVQIAGDISSAKLIEQLHDNADIPSIIIENEIDSLAKTIAKDYGSGISANLRKAYHQETISVQRQIDNRHIEVEKPKLAIVLAGTPEQMKTLIGNPQNGLYSRFMLLYLEGSSPWQSVVPCDSCPDRSDVFSNLSVDFYEFWQYMNRIDTNFKPTQDQWARIDIFGEQLSKEYSLSAQEQPLVRRHAHMIFRLAMTISAIRYWENGNSGSDITCTDQDLDIAIQLINKSLACSIDFLPNLIGNSNVAISKDLEYYNSLPQEFHRNIAIEKAKRLNLTASTMNRRLKHWIEEGQIVKTRHNQYEKREMEILKIWEDDGEVGVA